MRPQFHHLDAQSQITKTSLTRTSAAAKSASSKTQQPVTTAAIAAQRNKTTTESDNAAATSYEATNRFLESAADENWKRLWYRDEMDEESFQLFEEKMVLGEQAVKDAKELRSEWATERYLDAIRSGGPIEEEKLKKKTQPATGAKKKVVRKDATAGPSRR